jgi:hypothetical protein
MLIGAPCSCSRRTYTSACAFDRAYAVVPRAIGRSGERGGPPGAKNTPRLEIARGTAAYARSKAQVDQRGGVHDSVAAGKRFIDGSRVRHVADHDVSGNEAVRLEHGADLGGVAYQQPDFVPCSDERTHGVRAGETRAASNKYLHPARSCLRTSAARSSRLVVPVLAIAW